MQCHMSSHHTKNLSETVHFKSELDNMSSPYDKSVFIPTAFSDMSK